MTDNDDLDPARNFSLAVAKLMHEFDLEPPVAALAFGVIARALATGSSNPRAACQELVENFMRGMGAVVLDGDEAGELLDQEGAAPVTDRVLN